MSRYVQFFHNSTGYSEPVHLIPKCGSDGVLLLDGRLSIASCHAKARQQAKSLARVAPDIVAYRIEAGGRPFSGSRPITRLIQLESVR
jgi:hypothetical protein